MACSKYDNLFKKMCAYVKDYINKNYNNQSQYINSGFTKTYPNGESKYINCRIFKILIPKEFTRIIKEFADLDICVMCFGFDNIDRTKDSFSIFDGIGSTVENMAYGDNNGQINNVGLEIRCVAINGEFNDYSFMNVIRHEYNHLAEIYERTKKKKESKSQSLDRIKYNQKMNLINSKDKEISYVGQIIYTLWLRFELDAHATSVYSYLDSINSKRENFGKDIQQSEAYKIYNKIQTEYLPYIENSIIDENNVDSIARWEYIANLLDKKWGEDNPIKFKKMFIKQTNRLLALFFNKMTQIGELYYMEHPDNDVIENKPFVIY